ncbi:AlpA family phage regulatory protein [Salmonella enterica]|nr:AlpA family phage regulatory protein [Salmonella enterica]ELU4387848.1 AlpA family phage regulatory protein [Salmonella enterica]
MSMIDIHSDQMVDMAFIVRFTGMTDKWFYKLIQEGKFPKPIKMGRSSRWLESEVVTWFKEKVNESRME